MQSRDNQTIKAVVGVNISNNLVFERTELYAFSEEQCRKIYT